jgi:hypothetical protein
MRLVKSEYTTWPGDTLMFPYGNWRREMSTIKWKIITYSGEIEKIEVVSETACFITVCYKNFYGPRSYIRKEKKDGTVFDTFADARDSLVARAVGRVNNSKRELIRAENNLKDCINLTPPKEETLNERESDESV